MYTDYTTQDILYAIWYSIIKMYSQRQTAFAELQYEHNITYILHDIPRVVLFIIPTIIKQVK